MEYMFMPFKRYFEFTGRSRRMEFWMFMLFNVIVYIVLTAIAFGVSGGLEAMAGVDPEDTLAVYSAMFSGPFILLGIFALAVFIPSISVSVRRLHDRDMSGWWYLGFIVGSMIPFIGILISLAFMVLMFLPGTTGPNRFGEDPKNPTNANVFD
ncbi:MAG: DUF805 domain-containing protein [Marinomonas sp.]